MTDDELIDLLEQTPAEQLSIEQIELIRRRVAGSSTLRTALAGHLAFEQRMHAALGRPHLEVDVLLARVESRRTTVRALRWVAVPLVAIAMLSALVWWN